MERSFQQVVARDIAPFGGSGATAEMTTARRPITDADVEGFKEQDAYLPIANVSRIMRMCLPKDAKVSKEARECVQECVSEFISFVSNEASERSASEKRKTIQGEDILTSMEALGFENYSELLKIYLVKYRQMATARPLRPSGAKRRAMAAAQAKVEAESNALAENHAELSRDPNEFR